MPGVASSVASNAASTAQSAIVNTAAGAAGALARHDISSVLRREDGLDRSLCTTYTSVQRVNLTHPWRSDQDGTPVPPALALH